MVPAEGFEPTHHKAIDPKSIVSTNSTTQAFKFNQAGLSEHPDQNLYIRKNLTTQRS